MLAQPSIAKASTVTLVFEYLLEFLLIDVLVIPDLVEIRRYVDIGRQEENVVD